MALNYDGSITIDSSIDTKGFNDGIKKMGTNMRTAAKEMAEGFGAKLLGSIKDALALLGKIILVAGIAAVAVALIGATFVAVGAMALRFVGKYVDSLYASLSATSAFRSKVVELKDAFNAVKGAISAIGATLLAAVAPVLLRIIDWIVKALNWLSIFIAALTGQKTAMQYVSTAASGTAAATKETAKNVKEATKAAKNALAAFDEINVLQLQTAEAIKAEEAPLQEMGGGVGGGAVTIKEVDVPTDFIKTQWELFKVWFKENITDAIADYFKIKWENLFGGKTLWEVLFSSEEGSIWGDIFEDVEPIDWGKLWGGIKDFFTSNPETMISPVEEWAIEVSNIIRGYLSKAWEWLAGVIGVFWAAILQNATLKWNTWIGNVRTTLSAAWTFIKTVWGVASSWFMTNIISPIGKAFTIVTDAIKAAFGNAFISVKLYVKNRINDIIGFLNKMIAAMVKGVNALIGALNSLPKVTLPDFLGGGTIGWNIAKLVAPQIPLLAKGAVIPPNAAFAAVLGDQKSGTNIEAPEKLIRQIIQEEIGNIQTDVQISFAGSLGALVRELKPVIDKENTRIGTSLIKRSTA